MRRIWSTVLFGSAVLGLVTSAPAETTQERRLRLLEQQLQRTQDEIEQLRGELQQQQALGKEVQKSSEEAAQSAQAARSAVDATTKKTASLPDWLNRITPFGDGRLRYEGFYHQPHQEGQDVTARNRVRVRARLGLRANYSEEIGATIRIASGNINDPISTNQTLTGNFTPFSINLDWAYLTLTPGKTFSLRPGVFSVSGGKFPNPMFRVGEMVFDDDLSPEGINEVVQLLGKPIGDPQGIGLDQVKLFGEQWIFSEISNKQDGWMFGGQVNPTMHIGPIQVEAGLGQYWWLNPDQIAQTLSRNTTAFTAAGAPVANSSFNSTLVNTNELVIDRIQPPTPKGGKKPAAFTAITGFESDFNQTNVTLAATLPNVVRGQPLRAFLDYVNNWGADSKGFGWMGGLRLGQTKVKGDWSVYGLYEHLEQEAVISAFTWSDFGVGGTNQKGPVVGLDYQVLDPFTLSARAYFTNFIDSPFIASQGTSTFVGNPTQTRFQIDALVKF